LPPPKGIPVLVYHKVWPGVTNTLTITPQKLEEQWCHLHNLGYNPLSLSEFAAIIDGETECPPNSILITFDDGYKNNLTYVYPLLQQLGWCATIFIIAGTLDNTFSSAENIPMHELMDIHDLKKLDHRIMQIAMHGYKHENFSRYPSKEIDLLLSKAIDLFNNSGLAYYKVIAYPYGSDPKEKAQTEKLRICFTKQNIQFAFRTGNALCRLPVKNKYKLPRIDISGTDSLDDVLSKITYGRK